MIAIIIFAASAAKAIFSNSPTPGQRRHSRRMASLSRAERDKALDVYRDLAREKMDVIKTAVAMGYSEGELDKLDRRLEKLIGREKLEEIIDGGLPEADLDMRDRDLLRELKRLRDSDDD